VAIICASPWIAAGVVAALSPPVVKRIKKVISATRSAANEAETVSEGVPTTLINDLDEATESFKKVLEGKESATRDAQDSDSPFME